MLRRRAACLTKEEAPCKITSTTTSTTTTSTTAVTTRRPTRRQSSRARRSPVEDAGGRSSRAAAPDLTPGRKPLGNRNLPWEERASMATMITSRVHQLRRLRAECPNTAIYQGGGAVAGAGRGDAPAPSRTTSSTSCRRSARSASGFHDHEACAAVLPGRLLRAGSEDPGDARGAARARADAASGRERSPTTRRRASRRSERARGVLRRRPPGGAARPRRRPRPRVVVQQVAARPVRRPGTGRSSGRSRHVVRTPPPDVRQASCRASSTRSWRASARRARRPVRRRQASRFRMSRRAAGRARRASRRDQAPARGDRQRPALLQRAGSRPRATSS